jgi:hypothetical protein
MPPCVRPWFRGVSCGSPGPWEVADYWPLLGLALRARTGLDHEDLVLGRCELFDGTSLQTPAMGEDYLRGLLDQRGDEAKITTKFTDRLLGCESKAQTSAEPRADGPVLIVSHPDGPT